jgi:hypothetical protein
MLMIYRVNSPAFFKQQFVFSKGKNDMKKFAIITTVILLAAGCSNSSQQTTPLSSTTQLSSSTPVTASSTIEQPAPPSGPETLKVYNNAAGHYKVLYLNYFSLVSASQIKANNVKGVNISACVPYGIIPDECFVLSDQPYLNTNLSSAAVDVSVLPGINSLTDCANFSPQELQEGKVTNPVKINNLVFVTAESSDAGAGNFSQTEFYRTFSGNTCYELIETVRWAEAGNFDPPRAEFNSSDVWSKLDLLRNGFQITN